MIYSKSTFVPWQLKLFGKIILSRFPISYKYWNRVGIFKHGDMRDPKYAYDIFRKHYDRVTFARKGRNYVALELGPGDSLYSGLIAYCHGSSKTHLIDVGNYVTKDIKHYHCLVDYLKEKGHGVCSLDNLKTGEELFQQCRVNYGTEGIKSLRKIPDASVDFVWSQAVLEHVKRSEFKETLKQLRRVLRPDGVCSHRIDLKDHLGGGLNNLRFSQKIWESSLFSKSGFYTNRLRYAEIMNIFGESDFQVEWEKRDFWSKLPIKRGKLTKEYAALSENNLCVSGFDVVLRPK